MNRVKFEDGAAVRAVPQNLSAGAKRINPKILKIKENLNLKVYENSLFKGFMTNQYKF